MHKFIRLSITCLVILATAVTCVHAESLWVDAKSTSMCADKKAVKVGDIVTILIVESASSTQQASTDTKKSSQLEAGPGTGTYLDKIPLFKYDGGDSINASGSTTRSSTFTTTMTAVVTNVQKNGNLEIEGTRFVQTNKEKEEIKLTGIIRQEDISPDNTIPSNAIADAKITHMGSGPIGSRQKEGIISKIFKILF